jgi:hypothetical protein
MSEDWLAAVEADDTGGSEIAGKNSLALRRVRRAESRQIHLLSVPAAVVGRGQSINVNQ